MNGHKQSGTALVVCLILMSVLTLLATSTMSTSALELAMSGNEQYQARAFEAAETGIERAIASLAIVTPSSEAALTEALDSDDGYTAVIRPKGTTIAPAGYNHTFTAAHFEIESTGTSLRDTRIAHIQGLFVVQPPAIPPVLVASPPLCIAGIEIHPKVCAEIGTLIRTYWRTGSRTHP